MPQKTYDESFWNQRYTGEHFVYGTEPNTFLAKHAGVLTSPVLSLSEGEGRNAVFLASLGLDVLGVDISSVGLEKARQLAQSRGLKIRTEVADLAVYEPAESHFGGVVSIFAHLPGAIRQRLYPLIARSLKPGGVIVLEAYAESQLARHGRAKRCGHADDGGQDPPRVFDARADRVARGGAERSRRGRAHGDGLGRAVRGEDPFMIRIRIPVISLALIALAAGQATAQRGGPSMRGDGPAPESAPFSVTRADSALDAIVPPDAALELLASGFGLNEGPVWVPEGDSGYLLVSGLLDNVIYRIAADNTVSVFMERAGYSGTDVNNTGAQTRSGRSHVLLIGPSCTGLDSQGRLIWCADNDRTLMRLEPDGTRTVLSAGAPDGRRFSGPNDIAVRRDDGVYLTDNDFGLRGAGQSPDKEMDNGIWLIRDGESRLVLSAADLGGIPNGVALSPDERWLYLTAGQRLMRYAVQEDGSLGAGTLFTEGLGLGDGLKTDTLGNVYSTNGAGPGIVRITAPDGTLLGTLHLPIVGGEPKRQICATNVAFGDPDGKGLYITACDDVYRIRLEVSGLVRNSAQR